MSLWWHRLVSWWTKHVLVQIWYNTAMRQRVDMSGQHCRCQKCRIICGTVFDLNRFWCDRIPMDRHGADMSILDRVFGLNPTLYSSNAKVLRWYYVTWMAHSRYREFSRFKDTLTDTTIGARVRHTTKIYYRSCWDLRRLGDCIRETARCRGQIYSEITVLSNNCCTFSSRLKSTYVTLVFSSDFRWYTDQIFEETLVLTEFYRQLLQVDNARYLVFSSSLELRLQLLLVLT